MHVKLPSGDLNPTLAPPHITSIYTYGVTTAPLGIVVIGLKFKTSRDKMKKIVLNLTVQTVDLVIIIPYMTCL